MVRGYIGGKMDLFIEEHLKMGYWMAKVYGYLRIKIIIKGSINRIRNMGMGYIIGIVESFLKDCFLMIYILHCRARLVISQ